MEKIYRFYEDTAYGVAGIVLAENEPQAFVRATIYLSRYFNHKFDADKMNLCVWAATEDDDFIESFPYALAVNYL